MKTIQNLVYLALLALAMNAQTPTQIDVSRVKGAAQLGADGIVVAAQLPASQGGSGGSGASQTAQLLDWKFTRVSATQLRFGDNCLPSTPCNVDIGGTVLPFTDGPYLINLSGSGVSGSICVYVTPTSNALTVGVGSGLTTANISGSTNLAIVGNVNSCPQDSAKLAKWDVAAGAFNSTGSAYASYLSYKPSPLAGSGIVVSAAERDTIQVDTTLVLRKFTCAGGPAASLPSGATQGDICWDFNQTTPAKYVCANAAGCTVVGDWKAF
jgi:hypothetical protein